MSLLVGMSWPSNAGTNPLALGTMGGVLADQSSGSDTTNVRHKLPVAQPLINWPGRCQVLQQRQSAYCRPIAYTQPHNTRACYASQLPSCQQGITKWRHHRNGWSLPCSTFTCTHLSPAAMGALSSSNLRSRHAANCNADRGLYVSDSKS